MEDNLLTKGAVMGLLKLMHDRPVKKHPKHRKTLLKEKRSANLKAWHQMQRNAKEREAIKHLNRSNAIKAAWAKRKAAEAK
jgi:hypothetical protein